MKRYYLLALLSLVALTACTPGPIMDDKRYKPGFYNITEAEFTTADPSLAESEAFLTARQIVPQALTELLPEEPDLPSVNLVIEVTDVGRRESEYSDYYVDTDGKEHGSKDVELTISHVLYSNIKLLDVETGIQIAHSYVNHSVELDSYTKTSSFRESLFNKMFSGGESEVNLPAFYLEYAHKLFYELYPQLKKR